MGIDVSIITLSSSSYYVSSFANNLAESPDIGSVRVILPNDSDELSTLDEEIVDVYTINTPDSITDIMQISNPLFFYRLVRAVGKPDIVHVINELRFPFLHLYVIKRLTNAPIVLTVHEPDPYLPTLIRRLLLNPLQKANLKLLSISSDKYIVHGKALKSKLAVKVSDPEAITVVPHGTLAPYFTRWKSGSESNESTDESSTILFFGRAAPGKGIAYLIEAGQMLASDLPNLKIIIAGSGFDPADVPSFDKDVFEIYDTRLNEQTAAELFDRADVVTLPYTGASASGIISIAGGFSTPVVVTEVGALPEIVTDKKTGLVVPPADSNALRAALHTLLTNDSLRWRLGKNLYHVQQTDWSWDQIVEKTIDIYQECH